MAHPVLDMRLDESMPRELLLRRHADFLSAYEKNDDCTLDYLKLSGVFWTLTALDLLGELHNIDREAVLNLVVSCQQADGGLSPAPRHDSHLLSTLSGIQILALFGRMDMLNVDGATRFILSLQQPDGSFCGDQWGEIDTRFSFCAIASLHLMGRLDECADSGRLNVEACASYLERCQNLDGGFGTKPGSESHAGQTYCVLGALAILRELRRLDLDRAAWWLAERQLPSGGLNGRPEKKPDVCYSWWTLASLTILGRLTWIDEKKLTHFILASQDSETGGIADRPGDIADPFHTLFGLAGLSLIAHYDNPSSHTCPNGCGKNGDLTTIDEINVEEFVADAISLAKTRLRPINPIFCMPQYVIERMGLRLQMIN